MVQDQDVLLKRYSILVVEDDADFRGLLDRRLSQEGYDCIPHHNVEDALISFKAQKPDLVILDLGFRQASGAAFLSHLRDRERAGHTNPPVLVVSGYDDPEIVSFAKSFGTKEFLVKPINELQFLSTVKALIQ
jgi:DNA-binding response OmpR family regulator